MKDFIHHPRFILGIILAFGVSFFGFYISYVRAPADFPAGTIITIPHGAHLKLIADTLEEKHIVRSSVWLTNFVILIGRPENVTEGDYFFPEKENAFTVAGRIIHGDFKITPTKVTIPEGSSIFDIADIVKNKFKQFNVHGFLALAKNKEGYLFPDTYFFMPSLEATDVVRILSENFNEKIKTVEPDIATFGRSLSDVITMASILEGEARLSETRQIVAGILWKRLDEKMLLQVDSTFQYINGKTSAELTLKDLAIDSLYNTYKYRGLPPTPISNPGLDAIYDAVHPKQSPYYFFLTDKNGVMHYARTLVEHQANKKKYLR